MSKPHDPHSHSSAAKEFDEPDIPPTGFITLVVFLSFVFVAIASESLDVFVEKLRSSFDKSSF